MDRRSLAAALGLVAVAFATAASAQEAAGGTESEPAEPVESPPLAQQPTSQPPTAVSPMVLEPAKPVSYRGVVLQEQLEDARDRSKRARNALIGTSVATATGIAFIVVGNSQCQVVGPPGNESLSCNTAGDVLWGLGIGMAIAGGTGMLISGIILGVANKRKRQIHRDRRQAYSERKLRWDVPSGGLVF